MRLCLMAVALAMAATPAAAQVSVTTLGGSAARDCFREANDDLSTDTEACDTALRESALSPRDRRATLVNRGILNNRAGRFEAALADFDAALAGDEDLAEAWVNRGNTLLLMGRAGEAIDNYERALASGLTKAHLAWYNIGLAELARNDKAAARAAFEQALELAPGFTLAQAKLDELG